MPGLVRILVALFIIPTFFFVSAQGAIYTVSSNGDTGANTLRQAISNANASPGLDIINFNFGSPTTITLSSCLPQITDQVTIDGYSDPGASAGNLMIEVICPAGCNGFDFEAGSSGSIIQGLVISGGTTGIYLKNSNYHVVKGNYLGTNRAGTAMATSRLQDCIHLYSANHCTIGGTGGVIDRNILSGATQDGIRVENSSVGNRVINNYIGTDATGNVGLGNSSHGIEAYGNSDSLRVGGTTLSERNLISSNTKNGVYTNNCKSPIVKGNVIGMGIDGSTKLGNGQSGIDIENTGTGPAQVGGVTVAERNYLSCNGSFGLVLRNANNAVVEGNWLGVDMATGLLDYGNYDAAITVTTSSDVRIGGSVAGSGNICSASGNPGGGADGISIFLTSPRPIIKGNIIGLGADSITPLQNYGHGIECLTCDDGIIGGTSLVERNLIANSFLIGIQLVNSPRVTVVNNYIGTDVSGLLNEGGSQVGIHISNSANVVIGGTTSSTRNLINGNAQQGILVDGTSSGVTIKGNYIGIGSDGTTAIPNLQMGISVSGNQCNNCTIGGYTTDERNIISSNGTSASHHGISIDGGSSGHSVINNYIGTDISGTVAKGNVGSGININNVNTVLIDGNISSSNKAWGIQLTNASSIKVFRNKIGTDVTGTLNLGNTSEGLRFSATCIGDSAGGFLMNANTIAYNNGAAGVYVENSSQKNTITFNSIFCNSGPGITLQSSANESVPVPGITSSAANVVSGTGVSGNTIHVYRNVKADGGVKCNCEGEIYIGTTTVVGGVWSVTHNLGLSATDAASVTATQTTPNGSTSQFTPCASPLPIELISFEVYKEGEHSVRITWSTVKEINNAQFEIQRSSDGYSFETIDIMAGSGNSNTIINYSYIDEHPFNGINYYRLVQKDTDGQVWRSTTKVINLKKENLVIVKENEGWFIIATGDVNEVMYEVCTLTGSVIYTETTEVSDENRKIKIDLNTYSHAVYIIKAISDQGEVINKIVSGD